MPKFSKGDYVIHPGQGVCVVDCVTEHARPVPEGGEPERPEQFYQLYPAAGPRMRICFPVAKEDDLRTPVNAGEARRLIAEMPAMRDDAFTDAHSWTVEDHFMGGIRTGGCEDVLRTLKTMRNRLNAAEGKGKKPLACYSRIYKAARERATNELGLSLGVAPEEVERMIQASFAAARRSA